jgi:carboxypeptidase PM20D1
MLAMEIIVVTVLIVVAIVVALVVAAAGPSWRPPPHELDDTQVDAARVAELLSGYVTIDTSNPPGYEAWPREGEMPAHVAYLLEHWVKPLELEYRLLAGDNLAIFVPGPDDRRPAILLSHADVVPVDPADEGRWTHPPFSGIIEDGVVWGRGTLDNKGSAVMYLEAVRLLRQRGDHPSRSLVILVTVDEEVGGANGSGRIVRDHLEELGNPEIVLDEGSFILPDFLTGYAVGAVALAEKRFVSVRLSVEGEGGHASAPRPDSPPAVLARALHRIATWRTRSRIHPIVREALWRIGGAQGFPAKLVMRNPGVFRRVILGVLQKNPGGNAVIRDTAAITILRGGIKDNIIPGKVEAAVNARLLPGSLPEDFLRALSARIDDDRVQITTEFWPGRDRPTPLDTTTFRAIEAVAGAVFAELSNPLVMIPMIAPGATDCRYFAEAGLECYRFHPLVLGADVRGGVHGIDERISISNLERGTRFYLNLIQVL